MRHVRYATLLFLSGGIVGAILGYFGETTPAFLSWKFSLLELNRDILALIANNLVATFITALGPFIVAKVFRITSADFEGIAFLYMIPTLVLFLNGFSTGYFMGTLVTNVTLFLILLSIVPHGIFEIPAIILSGVIGLKNIEEVDSAKFVGRSLLLLVIFLILLGGYVEGNVTSHLSSLSTPIEIITLEGQKEVSAGVEFPVSIVVKNHGIKQGEYYLSISASSGERSYNELSLELGTTISERTFTIYSPGLQNYTVAVIREGGVVTQRKSSIQVKEPNVEIVSTFVPELFAGEDTVIEISIENHDDVKRDAILVFSSSTGAINQKPVSLEAGENLTYVYSTEIGQPGERRFEIAVVWRGLRLSSINKEAEVRELRISPKIVSIDIPKLRFNKTSELVFTMENSGSKGGDISVLIFDTDMPQLLDTEGATGIFLRKSHLGSGIWEKSQLYLDAGEKRNVSISITPKKTGRMSLMVYALRKEVISDVKIVSAEVESG